MYTKSDNIIKINISIKNVSKIMLQCFKMNTITYYKKNWNEISSDLNLDGIKAKIDKIIKINNYKSEFEIKNIEIPLAELCDNSNDSNIYFIDLIGNGLHCWNKICKEQLL